MSFWSTVPWKRLVWAIWLPIYLTLFFIMEAVFPGTGDNYWITSFPFEENIPVLEVFVVPYLSWFPFLFGIGANLFYFHGPEFKRYMLLMCVTFFSCAIFWMFVPNRQDLRPEYLERANVFTWILKFIYNFDTPTNVFPSEHAVGTTAALLALWDCGYMKRHRLGGCLFLLWGALIIASTALTKQHALIDLPAGILLALIGGAFVYRKRLKGTAPVSF